MRLGKYGCVYVVRRIFGFLHFFNLHLMILASAPALKQTVYPPMIAAVLKGLGAGTVILESAQWAYIADEVAPARRSTYFSLALFIKWAIPIMTFSISSRLVDPEEPTVFFNIAFWCWVSYVLVVDMHLPDNIPDILLMIERPELIFVELVKAVVDPLRLTFGDSSLTSLAIVFVFAALAMMGVDYLVRFAFGQFGKPPIDVSTPLCLLCTRLVLTCLHFCRPNFLTL